MDQKELRELEDRCIQECPPACVTACPVHVDVKLFLAEMKKGNFDGALKIFSRTVPFPGILGRICDHPCQDACRRREAGGAVSIGALEKACVQLSPALPVRVTPPPRKKEKIAVVGGGLSGLTAAFDLAGKGYGVTIFEAEGRLGGKLWEIPEEVLPRQVIKEEIGLLEKMGVEVRLNTTVGKDITLEDLGREFDAVYLGLGANPKDTLGLKLDQQGRIEVHPVTLATGHTGVFAGGGLRAGGFKPSPVGAVSDGRRAAVSIDRYLQKVSLTAGREKEGPYQTRLYTSLEGVEPLPAVAAGDPVRGYTREEAIREAGRCLQCQCLECVKACEYLARFGSYPRRYVREVYNNESIVMGMHLANKLINSCSLCGLCQVICPNDFHMGEVCKKARESMVSRGKMPPSVHDFALRDMQFSNGEKFALARPDPGTAAGGSAFFPGCQLSASAPEYVEKVYAYLRERVPGGVGLVFRCCGAPADWAGRKDIFLQGREEILRLWKDMGEPRFILACSSCYQVFKTFMPEIEIISLWEIYDRLGLPQALPEGSPRTVAVHDACSTRHEEHIHKSVRSILKRLGYSVQELKCSGEKTGCCGYGGLMTFANPELAARVVDRRAGESGADYVAYCAMCRDRLAAGGKRALHLLDLIYGDNYDRLACRKGPGYSQRHENRARLKRKMLKEVWGEEVEDKKGFETIELYIGDDIRELMENRLILVEDIQKVIDYAEKTGKKLFNADSKHYLACYRPVSVTYWVEYSPQGAGYKVYNAYSHRMQIIEEVKS